MDSLSHLRRSFNSQVMSFAHKFQVDCLQTNSYDCGLWVLASIAAVLQGFDMTGFSETDMPWFRQFLISQVLTLPVLT
jgi:Ulp1 family protease